MRHFATRVRSRYQRFCASRLHRRMVPLTTGAPMVSVTFDDFPLSALEMGGAILRSHGAVGTFYTSFGLLGTESPSGRIAGPADLERLVDEGHELACHTYGHCHSWDTPPRRFVESVAENLAAAQAQFPGFQFRSFSYPLCCPRPSTKGLVGQRFTSARGGGQVSNVGQVDLNYVASFFIEKCRHAPLEIKRLMDRAFEDKAWLVLNTHDVARDPSPYGCTPQLLEELVRHALDNHVRILTMGDAASCILGTSGHSAE